MIDPDGTYLKFFYNTDGQRVQSIDQTGFIISYSYDDAGRLSELTDGDGNLIVQYTYDANGPSSERQRQRHTRDLQLRRQRQHAVDRELCPTM